MKTFNKKKLIALSVMGVVTLASASFGVVNASANDTYAITDQTLQIQHGAALRIGTEDGNNGIGYKIYVDDAEYANILANTGAGKTYKSVSYGVLIAPYAYHSVKPLNEENVFGVSSVYDYATWANGEWSYEGSKVRIINLSTDELAEDAENGNYYYKGYIVNVKDDTTDEKKNNLATEFFGVGYISYTLNSDDSVHYEFASYENNHISAAYVAQKELEKAASGQSKLNQTQLDWLEENYVDKAPASAATTYYNVEKYVDGVKVSTQKVENATVGTTVSATPETDKTGYTYNAEASKAYSTVYYNGKTTLQMHYDVVPYTETEEYLVDVQNLNTFADLASTDGKATLADYEGLALSCVFTDAVSGKEYAISDIADIANVPYTRHSLTVKFGETAVYTAPVDLYDSTARFVWNDAFDSSYLSTSDGNLSAGEIKTVSMTESDNFFMGAGNYFYWTKQAKEWGSWGKTRIFAQHSLAYYQAFQDATMEFDVGFTPSNPEDTGIVKIVEMHGQTGTQTVLNPNEKKTLTVTVADLIENFESLHQPATQSGKYFLLDHSGTAGAGTFYIGNFRGPRLVNSYTETTEYLLDKQEVTSLDKLGSTTGGQAHLAEYANETLSYTFTDVVTTEEYTITNISELSAVPSTRYTLTVTLEGGVVYTAPIDLYDSTEGFVWNNCLSAAYHVGQVSYTEGIESRAIDSTGTTFMGSGNFIKIYTSKGNFANWSAQYIKPQHSKAYYELAAWEGKTMAFDYGVELMEDPTNQDAGIAIHTFKEAWGHNLNHGTLYTYTISVANLVKYYDVINGTATTEDSAIFFVKQTSDTTNKAHFSYFGNFRLK